MISLPALEILVIYALQDNKVTDKWSEILCEKWCILIALYTEEGAGI